MKNIGDMPGTSNSSRGLSDIKIGHGWNNFIPLHPVT